jgi:hypothetical protein
MRAGAAETLAFCHFVLLEGRLYRGQHHNPLIATYSRLRSMQPGCKRANYQPFRHRNSLLSGEQYSAHAFFKLKTTLPTEPPISALKTIPKNNSTITQR